MKKLIIILLATIFLFGCSKKTETNVNVLIPKNNIYIKTYRYFDDIHLVLLDTTTGVLIDKNINYKEYLYVEKYYNKDEDRR